MSGSLDEGAFEASRTVVETLRKEGFAGRLVMVAGAADLPDERPPLPRAVLAGDVDTLDIQTWQPDCATSIDRTARGVEPRSGREVEDDRLVIATVNPRVFACGGVPEAVRGAEVAHAGIPWFCSGQYDVNALIPGDLPADAQLAIRVNLAGSALRSASSGTAPCPAISPSMRRAT
ncbi:MULTISPECIES: hypothetical protein [unclassified Caballeronia]|uniref:hypothetical protein n=1 Tax=unclassified Caballeronia TaxID=2646786 RepID=UPI002865BE2B|nr:hypothetical protein [Caballeronia sp. LZ033]MDR5880102.1 hypothetical protein [Caballeronia sp. LZ032]